MKRLERDFPRFCRLGLAETESGPGRLDFRRQFHREWYVSFELSSFLAIGFWFIRPVGVGALTGLLCVITIPHQDIASTDIIDVHDIFLNVVSRQATCGLAFAILALFG